MYYVRHYCSDTFSTNLALVYMYRFKNDSHNKWQYRCTMSCKHNYLNRICSINTGVVKKFGLRKLKETDNNILNFLSLFNFFHTPITNRLWIILEFPWENFCQMRLKEVLDTPITMFVVVIFNTWLRFCPVKCELKIFWITNNFLVQLCKLFREVKVLTEEYNTP